MLIKLSYCLAMCLVCFGLFAEDQKLIGKPIQGQQYNIDFFLFDKQLVTKFNQGSSQNAHLMVMEKALEHLPKRFSLNHLPSARVFKALNSDTPTCSPAKIKNNERISQYLFTNPTALTPSARLYAKQKLPRQLLNTQGQLLKLEDLAVVNQKFKIFYSSYSSFGDDIDQQLKNLNKAHKRPSNTVDYFGKKVEMFLRDRGDFLISAPVLLAREYPEAYRALNAYEMAGSDAFMLGHIMCNKTPETTEFINNFNLALRKLYKSGEYLQINLEAHPAPMHHELQRYIEVELSQIMLNP